MPEHRPRIVTHAGRGPARTWPWVLAGALAGASAVGIAWWQLPPIADADHDSGQLQQVQAAVDEATRKLALLTRGQKITEAANADLRAQLISAESEQAGLREEIAFYRRLLDVGGSFRGLAIHDLRFDATASEQVFEYRLILSQNLNKAATIGGAFDFAIDGVAGDRAESLTSAQVGVAADQRQFSFKYYQQLRGSVTLPGGFVPTQVTVWVVRDGQDKRVQQTYDWPSVLE